MSSRMSLPSGLVIVGVFAVFVCFGCFYSGPVLAAEPVDFNETIKPILSDRCFACHGPDEENRAAELRLDRREDATAESNYGELPQILVPGDPDQSELMRRIEAHDPDLRMPPADSGLSLTPDEIALVRRWIAEGASYREHWAYRSLGPVMLPAADENGWARNAIDRFVLQRMNSNALRPTVEADRETLIRRLSFDLTGLPPTVAQVEAFVNDKRPDAYERLVDRLLQSVHFGERLTSEWLDVARYSDTYGYQVDRDRFVWPWRDWVIRAFNANMPYDQFIRLQLAGDLLPNPTDDQILATTFCRLHPQKVEGGSVPEEFRIEYVADRTQTVATAFLGLTLECARCHDHKYDPLSQREYYQLTAFFDNIDEAGLYSYFTEAIPTPTLLLHTDQSRRQLAELESELRELEGQHSTLGAESEAAFLEWFQKMRAGGEQIPTEQLIPGRIAHVDFEQIGETANAQVDGVRGSAIRLTGDDAYSLSVGNFTRSDPFSISLWIKTPDVKSRSVVFHRSRAWTDAASRGYELLIEDGRLSAALIHFWPGNAIRQHCTEPLPVDRWVHVAITYDGSSRAEGLKIYMDGKCAETQVVRDNLYKDITGGGNDHITIGERFRDRGFTKGCVDEFSVYERRLTTLEVAELAGLGTLTELISRDTDPLTSDQTELVQEYFLATQYPPTADHKNRLREVRKQRDAAVERVAEIMVMRELPQQKPTHLLKRGAYDAPGDEVAPETPQVLPALAETAPRNRLGLADWLVGPNQALTARVTVNRYWQLMFGEGLVRTPEDFGSQGRPPTHPQLLDWLAADFVAHQWDLKRLLRLMATSATYRQSSRADADSFQRDPENLWLSRAFRLRLSAEMIRDNALASSRLMQATVGGPPARPYELQESFKPTDAGAGTDVYRRSVYTYWKRTAPAPVMMAFDASKRDVCRVRRERTASPIQSVVLLNDPQMVEAARSIAVELLNGEAPSADGARDAVHEAHLMEVYRLLTSRRPGAAELQALRALLDEQIAYFAAQPAERDAYLQVGRFPVPESLDRTQVAAYAIVVNTLLGFDAAVTRR